MKDFLKRYRTRLKLEATQHLEATITKIFNIIADDSALKNTIIMVQARYQNLEADDMKGIIAGPDRELRTNQIMNSLFQLIDNIECTDLQESDDVVLNEYLKKEKASLTKPDEAEISKVVVDEESIEKTTLTATAKEETPVADDIPAEATLARTEAKKEGSEVTPKSAKDLEIFSEIHRKTLTFFPVIYRDLRSLVFKNGKASLEMGQFQLQIEKVLPALQSYQTKMDQLEPILKKARVDFDKKVYWMQFQQLSNKRTGLKMGNLSEIDKMNKELNTFIESLKKNGIVK